MLSIEEDIPSVLRGSFSTTRRGLKPKKVKGKESWVFKYRFRVKRDGEIFWSVRKLYVSYLNFLINYILTYASFVGNSTVDELEFGEHVYILKHGPSSISKHLKGPAHRLFEHGQLMEAPLLTTLSMHYQMVTRSYSFSLKVFRVKLLRFIAMLY